MKKTWIAILMVLASGCGQAPPPTGPAAEATTPEVEVTMPEETPSTSATPEKTTAVSFNVPGMT